MKHVAGSQNTNIYTNLSSLNPRWDVRKSQVVDSCQNKEITLYKYTLDRNANFEFWIMHRYKSSCIGR